MILTSPSFQDDTILPRKFTCDGGGINPELEIHNVPSEARSLALIVHDPDAPIEGGFTHWVIWNIDPATTIIKEESTPPGSVEGNNGADEIGWTPPAPPLGHGVHHYEFYLYALDEPIDLPDGASAIDLRESMEGHILEETQLTGLYERK